MSLILFIFIGLFGAFFITFLKSSLINLFGENNILLFKLKNAGWFQNYWWLASLYTKPENRGRGVGKMLIDKAISVVSELGYDELYLRTEDASDYYRNRGWTYLETVSDEKYNKIDVFKIKCK